MNGASASGAKDSQAGERPQLEYVSVKDAAARLSISGESLRRAIYRGELRGFLLGHALRIRRSDLDGWIAGNQWSPALCSERTARPRAGRRKRMPRTAAPELPTITSGATVAQ